MVEPDCALEAKFFGPSGKARKRDAVAEDILDAADTARLRCDLKFRFKYALVVAIHWSQHHPMLAKGNRPSISVSRDVPDREDCHSSPRITKDMTNAAKL